MSTQKENYWNLTDRPHTKLKLEIYKKYLDSWCTIFLNQEYYKDIYIVDCFAGSGRYKDSNESIDGSPLIAVKAAEESQQKFCDKSNKNKEYFRINCIFIEKNKECCENLRGLLDPYRNNVNSEIINGDFNDVIEEVLRKIGSCAALFFIDPYGIKPLKKESMIKIIGKVGPKDILLNYINEGVKRITGVAKKCAGKSLNDIIPKEIKTIENLNDFFGSGCLDMINCRDCQDDIEFLRYYVKNVIKSNNKNVDSKNQLSVIAFDMPYPHKSDIIYYLLFVSRNNTAIKIVREVYAKSKETNLKGHRSLFDAKELLKINNNFEV